MDTSITSHRAVFSRSMYSLRYWTSYLVAAVCTLLLMGSCAGSKVATKTFNEYALASPREQAQTKSNVTIEVAPLSPSTLYDHPELFSFDIDALHDKFKTYSARSYFREDLGGRSWCYTFGSGQDILTAFSIKITNKTPHILRMKDARIYLVVAGEDPQAAVAKLGNAQLYVINEEKGDVAPKSAIDGDESLIHWVTYFERKAEQERPKGLVTIGYPIGIASQVIAQNKKQYKLINDVGREILPDFSYEGILLFPVVVSFETVKLTFFDITTKTDAAGNPVEKTKFEFDLKLENVDMWYDKVEKRWKKGLPPAAGS